MLEETRQGFELNTFSAETFTLKIENDGYLWIAEREGQKTLTIAFEEPFVADAVHLSNEEYLVLQKISEKIQYGELSPAEQRVVRTINYTVAAFCDENELEIAHILGSSPETQIQPERTYSDYRLSEEEVKFYEDFPELVGKLDIDDINSIDLAFHTYLKHFPLSTYKEIKLIREYKYTTDPERRAIAEEEIIGSTFRWIDGLFEKFLAKNRYRLRSIDEKDLIQEAVTSAWLALDKKFEIDANTRFITYVKKPVVWAMYRYLANMATTVKVPVYAQEIELYTRHHTPEETKEYIAQRSNGRAHKVKLEEIINATKNAQNGYSYDQSHVTKDGDEVIDPVEIILARGDKPQFSRSAEQEAEPSIVSQEIRDYFNQYFDVLTPAQRNVFSLYLKGFTYSEIGEYLGITESGASDHGRKAMKRILATAQQSSRLMETAEKLMN